MFMLVGEIALALQYYFHLQKNIVPFKVPTFCHKKQLSQKAWVKSFAALELSTYVIIKLLVERIGFDSDQSGIIHYKIWIIVMFC